MNSNSWIFFVIALCSVLIADVSQIILKKAAMKTYSSWIRSYLNFPVVFSYFLFFVSTICSVIALKHLPLSLAPMWQSMGQIFVVLLSYFFLNEKITKKKCLGIILIIIGIIMFGIF